MAGLGDEHHSYHFPPPTVDFCHDDADDENDDDDDDDAGSHTMYMHTYERGGWGSRASVKCEEGQRKFCQLQTPTGPLATTTTMMMLLVLLSTSAIHFHLIPALTTN
uniref:Uncharacterized protein n=1 Tax=Anopheles culicifacies TaxID=139723 RepID=A0A182MFM9_9DIPT